MANTETHSHGDAELHDVAAARMKKAGQRYTTGRRALVDGLAVADGPVTITQILDSTESLAQSSAYRNLSVLEEAGVVHRIVTSDDFARYELAEELTEHHHHLICTSCGDVVDFMLSASLESELDAALSRAAKKHRFSVAHHRLDLVGTCQNCR